jgi:hypothetical protein
VISYTDFWKIVYGKQQTANKYILDAVEWSRPIWNMGWDSREKAGWSNDEINYEYFQAN